MLMQAKRALLVCLCAVAVGLFIGLSAQSANAQVLYGSLLGTVTDQSGAVVPNADVTMTNKETGFARQTKTDNAGRYSAVNIPSGLYTVKAMAAGFSPFVQDNLPIQSNQVARLDLQLKVGAVAQQVTVEATPTMLQTSKADVHAELGMVAVANLPLNQYRNYQKLIDLVPGATPGRFQNAITDTPARALTTNINGTNRNNNVTRVDGATNVFVWLPHHTVYVAPEETIQEVNISTNNFDAEQGLAGGAAINVETKSGTNNFHGEAHAFHEDNALRALQFFEKRGRPGAVRPKGILNTDGGTIGGPIMKDKLFFFGGWEGTYERDARSSLFSVPTGALRRGDFTGTGRVIFDPSTGNLDGTGRLPFANQSAIPINPVAAKIIALIPPPNLPGESNNFFNSGTQRLTRNNYDAKINWNRTENHMIWGKISTMVADVTGDVGLGAAGGACLCDGGTGTGHTNVKLVTIGHTWTLSPNLVIDGTIGFARMSQQVIPPFFGQNIGLDVLGIPGTNDGNQPFTDERQSGFPAFFFTTFSDLGNTEEWNPLFRNDQSWTHTDNVTYIKGAHQIRFGFDLVHHHLNHWQPELGSGPRGAFTFGGGVTALNGGVAPNQFNSFAAFLLGAPTSFGKSIQLLKATGNEWQLGWYIQDRWQVSPKLTATLGLRYEYFPLITRNGEGGGIEVFDPATNQVLLGGRGSVPQDVGVTVSNKLFAPRIGLAYRLNDATVIRSGYGITYDPLPLSRPLRGFYPLTIGSDFSGANSFAPAGTVVPSALNGIYNVPVGIPGICCPDLSTGVVKLPLQAIERSPGPGELTRGYIQSWNFIVERSLPSNFVVSVGYVGTQTVHQFADQSLNAGSINTAPGTKGQPLFQKFGRTSTFTNLFQGFLSANYHALQTSVNRRFSNGLFLKGAYTWGHAIDWTDDDGWAGLDFNDPAILSRNRARAGFDVRHNFQLAWVYELPFGKGKHWASAGGLASKLVGGWQVNGLLSAFSGRPFTIITSGASLNVRGSAQTADQVKPEIQKLDGPVFDTPFFDTTAFAPVTTRRYGTSGRNIVEGPGVFNADMSVFRNFALTEKFKLQFRAEAANVANTPHFNNPNRNVTGGNFGKITSAVFDPRQFRFGLKLMF